MSSHSNHPPIQDEFTNLPISPQLKAYRRRLRDHKCVMCGKGLRGSKTTTCRDCTKKRTARRRSARMESGSADQFDLFLGGT